MQNNLFLDIKIPQSGDFFVCLELFCVYDKKTDRQQLLADGCSLPSGYPETVCPVSAQAQLCGH